MAIQELVRRDDPPASRQRLHSRVIPHFALFIVHFAFCLLSTRDTPPRNLPFPPAQATTEIGREGRIERLAGAEQRVVNTVAGASAADVLEELLQCRQVSLAQGPWIAVQVIERLQAIEAGWTREGKLQFIVI